MDGSRLHQLDRLNNRGSQLSVHIPLLCEEQKRFRQWMTKQLWFDQGLNNEGNKDDLIAFMLERNLPVDEIEASNIADEILINPPVKGFLTISNALQWRLQYGRVIERAGQEDGVIAVSKINP